MKTIRDVELSGKRVLVRSDLNSDVSKGRLLESVRIKESVNTIKYLKKKGAKVVILAHQGNVGKKDFISLRAHARQMNKYLKVDFVEGTINQKAIERIKKQKKGDVLLLENVRFVKDEFSLNKKKNALVDTLCPLFDLYVNDAFSVCHRDQASITALPKKIEPVAGLLLEKELDSLKKLPEKNTLYILGGAKPESNIKLLNGNRVLACGLFGQTCLRARGIDLGYQNDFLKKNTLVKGKYERFLEKLEKKMDNVLMPKDFAVNVRGKRKEMDISEFPQDFQIDDIGEKTIRMFEKEIKKAKAIYMKGPAGNANEKQFSKGTNRILRAIADSNAFSLIGGGHLSDAIQRSRIAKKNFGHISLSGGALLNYVAGKRLVGLEAMGWYE